MFDSKHNQSINFIRISPVDICVCCKCGTEPYIYYAIVANIYPVVWVFVSMCCLVDRLVWAKLSIQFTRCTESKIPSSKIPKSIFHLFPLYIYYIQTNEKFLQNWVLTFGLQMHKLTHETWCMNIEYEYKFRSGHKMHKFSLFH